MNTSKNKNYYSRYSFYFNETSRKNFAPELWVPELWVKKNCLYWLKNSGVSVNCTKKYYY